MFMLTIFRHIAVTVMFALVCVTPRAEAQDSKNQLLLAIKAGDLKKVEQILASRASVNSRGEAGVTPLILASQGGKIDIIKLLLDRNADINAQNDKGFTALMIAARAGHADAVKVLLERGADREIKNETGFTAFEIARAFGHAEVINVFAPGTATETTTQAQSKTESPESVQTVQVAVVDRKRKCMPILAEPDDKSKQLACARLGERIDITEKWEKDTWVMIVKPVQGWVLGANLKHIVEENTQQTQSRHSEAAGTQSQPRQERPAYREEPAYVEQNESSENEHYLQAPQGGSSWWRR